MNNILINPSVGLKGHYRLVKRNSKGDVLNEYEFDNVITNAGLNQWGSSFAFNRCVIGTGTATPTISDTTLASQSASTTALIGGSTVSSGAPNYHVIKTLGYRFPQGTLNGNYAEVGVDNTTTGAVFSRSLILDNLGNPTTITILPSEVLDVYYILTIQIDKTLRSGSMLLNGTTTVNFQIQASQVNSGFDGSSQQWSFPQAQRFGTTNGNAFGVDATNGAFQSDALGTNWGNGGTVITANGNTSIGSYINGTYYNDLVYTLNIGELNGTFDKFRYTTAFGRYAVDMDTTITKTLVNTFTISMRYSWNCV